MDFMDQLSMVENWILFEEKSQGYIDQYPALEYDPYLFSWKGAHFNFDKNFMLQSKNHMPRLEFGNFANIESDVLMPLWDVNVNLRQFHEVGIIDTKHHMYLIRAQNLDHGPNFKVVKNEIPIVNFDYKCNFGVVQGEGSSTIDTKELVISNSYKNREHRRYRSRPIPLELDEIQKYFHVPIAKAAEELNVGLTMFKKRCRELKIMRWPCRKIKSVEFLIDNVKELGLMNDVKWLEENKELLEKVPQLELTERVKKLRQDCFNINYKKRRLLD